MIKMKKRILIFTALVGFLAMFTLPSCERVKPNHVGVLMEHFGKNGKSDFTNVKGRVPVWQAGTELFQVPLYEQRAIIEDSLHLTAADNTALSCKVSYSYNAIENRAVDLVFQNKQLESDGSFMTALENNILEAKIYDLMKEESRSYVTDTLMASGGSLRFEQHVQQLVRQHFEEKGLQLQTFSCLLNFSEKVRTKIDTRNEVNTNVTVLDQQIIEQRKKNELVALQRDYNKILSEGITQQILQQQFIEKWDGKTPLYGNLPVTLFKNTQ